jgi:DNA polymerase III delta subunit
MMIERCGRDMFNLASETDKLAFYALSHSRDTLTREDVINVATPVADYDAYAFTNAIGARRREEALAILKDMKRRRLEPIIIVSEISGTINDMLRIAVLRADGLTQKEISSVTKIHEYRIGIMMRTLPDLDTCKRMLTLAKSADAEIKSSLDGFTVIERLICSI